MSQNEHGTNSDQSKTNPTNQRRKALKSVIAGGAIAATWQTPVIKSVMLPAHAQTSGPVTDTDTDTDDQAAITRDFFATVADASEVNSIGHIILATLIPEANAKLATNEEPVDELKFEAEAINQGNDQYKLTIAADHIDPNGRINPSSTNFIFGWEGTISNINNAGSVTGTGCAQNETAIITAVSSTSMTIQMSYFSTNIELILDAGNANLPSFPLTCN